MLLHGIGDPHTIIQEIEQFEVQVLPTTPTFLRMMLAGGTLDNGLPSCLKVITYGTERMDQVTLKAIASLLPNVDLRQTYGMSELGILRVRSQARDSLYMKVGGEGVKTTVVDEVLKIQSEHRMLGYLNALSPFDSDGWYDTGDVVEEDGEYIKVVGRTNEVINIGGIKVNPSYIESEVLQFPGIADASAYGKDNPLTGQHIELLCEPRPGVTLSGKEIRKFLAERLSRDVLPHRVRIGTIVHNHRFKSR